MYSLNKLQEDKQAEFYDMPYYDASAYTDNIRILGIYRKRIPPLLSYEVAVSLSE